MIQTQCDGCFREYKLDDKYAGKTIRCKDCGKAFKVEAPGAAPEFVDEYDAPPPPTRSAAPRSGAPRKSGGKRAAQSSSGSGSKVWMWVVGGAVGVLLVCCGGVAVTVMSVKQALVEASTPELALGDPTGAFPMADVPLPEFPPLGAPSLLDGGVQLYEVDFGSVPANDDTPGKRMKLRVYLPQGEHAEHSLPCVLVAPAGSNLLSGMALDGGDYHDETLPYAEAGMAVVAYSLDGTMDETSQEPEQIREVYLDFRAARAGIVNGRNALDFALARLPQVDPQRIYTAGHSSAGTLSLLMAAHEPRLRGALAYAPATDLETRMGEVGDNPILGFAFPGFGDFLKQSSPKTHASRINCPVFVFHARDDSNEPFTTTESFVGLLQSNGKVNTFQTAESGDHYQSMIDEGIPGGVEWIKSQSP